MTYFLWISQQSQKILQERIIILKFTQVVESVVFCLYRLLEIPVSFRSQNFRCCQIENPSQRSIEKHIISITPTITTAFVSSLNSSRSRHLTIDDRRVNELFSINDRLISQRWHIICYKRTTPSSTNDVSV